MVMNNMKSCFTICCYLRSSKLADEPLDFNTEDSGIHWAREVVEIWRTKTPYFSFG